MSFFPQAQHPFLIKQALEVLQDHSISSESEAFDSVVSLVQNTNVFQRSISSSAVLESFFKHVRHHFDYEVHPYGTTIIKEKDFADKLCIVLQGKIEKLQQESLKKNAPVQPNKNLRKIKATLTYKDSMLSLSPSINKLNNDGSFNTFNFLDSAKLSSKLPSRQGSFDGSLNDLDLDKSIESIGSIYEQSSNFNLSPPKPSFQTKSSQFFQLNKGGPRRGKSIIPSSRQSESPFLNDEILPKELLEPKKKMTLAKAYFPGDHFGENFCRHHRSQEKAIFTVSSEEVHLVTLSRDAYKNVLHEVKQEAYIKSLFFSKFLPNFDQRVLLRFSKYFTEKSFRRNDILYCQNDSTDALYFVVSGEIKLAKESLLLQKSASVRSSPTFAKSPKKLRSLAVTISEGQAFGEEILHNEPRRQHTAIISKPNTLVYALNIQVFEKIKERYEDLFDCLREQASEKAEWRQDRGGPELPELNLRCHTLPTRELQSPTPEVSIKKSAFHPLSPERRALSPQPNALATYWTTFSRVPKDMKKKEPSEVPKRVKLLHYRNISMESLKAIQEKIEKFSVRKELGISPLKPEKLHKKAKQEKSTLKELLTSPKSNSHTSKGQNKEGDKMFRREKLAKYHFLSSNFNGTSDSLLATSKLSSDKSLLSKQRIGLSKSPSPDLNISECFLLPINKLSQSTKNSSLPFEGLEGKLSPNRRLRGNLRRLVV